MPNGRPGDHPYTDMVAHELDWGEPEIAARVRAIDKAASLEIRELLADLIEAFHFTPSGLRDDYNRERFNKHLATLEKICAGGGKS